MIMMMMMNSSLLLRFLLSAGEAEHKQAFALLRLNTGLTLAKREKWKKNNNNNLMN